MDKSATFLIISRTASDPKPILVDSLRSAFGDQYDEPPEDQQLESMLELAWSRSMSADGDRTIHKFVLRLEALGTEASGSAGEILASFCDELREAAIQDQGPILHVLKFIDSEAYRSHETLHQEIYEIEMRLREVLSFMFLDEYPTEVYTFLDRTIVSTTPKDEKPTEEQLRAYQENQLFHILFNEYAVLNDVSQTKLDALLKRIKEVDSFEELKEALTNLPIKTERHAGFIASLRKLLEPVERVRNCVAHNRTVPTRTMENYPEARKQILAEIDRFWQVVSEE